MTPTWRYVYNVGDKTTLGENKNWIEWGWQKVWSFVNLMSGFKLQLQWLKMFCGGERGLSVRRKGRKSGKQVVLIETRDRLGSGVRRQWSELLQLIRRKTFSCIWVYVFVCVCYEVESWIYDFKCDNDGLLGDISNVLTFIECNCENMRIYWSSCDKTLWSECWRKTCFDT